MSRRHRMAALALTILIVVFGELYAQQEDDTPPTEFVFARWQYGRGGNGGWWHDYPDAEEHINQIMKEATGIDAARDSYTMVPISSADIFKYPFGYISEPGMMYLTDVEVKNFREFTERGGFCHD
jgi:hypothetical protein